MSDDPLMVEVKKSAARVSVSSDEEVVVTQAPAKKKIPSDREWLDNLDQESLKVLKKNTKSPREVEDLSLKCTSCYQQINHLLPVSSINPFFNTFF